jgi:hypothetical protein
MNPFLRKSIATALDISTKEVDAIMNAAAAFRSNEINRDTAIEVFNKLSKKTPAQINDLLGKLKSMI